MASNSINAFEGKLLEALNLLPEMGKNERSEALRLFGQTAQFFHLQQEQQRAEEEEEGNLQSEHEDRVTSAQRSAEKSPTGNEALTAQNYGAVEPAVDTVLDPTPADLFDDTRLGVNPNGDMLSSLALIENTEFHTLNEEDVSLMIARRDQLDFDLNLDSRSFSATMMTPTRSASTLLLTPTRPITTPLFTPTRPITTPVPLLQASLRSPNRLLTRSPTASSRMSPRKSSRWSPIASPRRSPTASPTGVRAASPRQLISASLFMSPNESRWQQSFGTAAPSSVALFDNFNGRVNGRGEEEEEEGNGENINDRGNIGHLSDNEESEDDVGEEEDLPLRLTHFSDDETESVHLDLEDAIFSNGNDVIARSGIDRGGLSFNSRENQMADNVIESGGENYDVGSEKGAVILPVRSFGNSRKSNIDNEITRDINAESVVEIETAEEHSRDLADDDEHDDDGDDNDSNVKNGVVSVYMLNDDDIVLNDDDARDKVSDDFIDNEDVNHNVDADNDHDNAHDNDADSNYDNEGIPPFLSELSGEFISDGKTKPQKANFPDSLNLDLERRRELAKNASIGKIGSHLKSNQNSSRITTRKLGLKWSKDGELMTSGDGDDAFVRSYDDSSVRPCDDAAVRPPIASATEENAETKEKTAEDNSKNPSADDPSASEPSTTTDEFVCPICGKEIVSGKGNFSAHVRRHEAAPKPFTCLQCGVGYQTRQNLERHQKSRHWNLKPHECPKCGKLYARDSTLKVHLKTHQEEKAFICNECGKSFHTNDYLKEHLKMHAGVRDYLCDFCGKGFLRYSHWKVHMKRHKSEKNYDCDDCDKKFITNADLLRHKWVHKRHLPKSQYPFQCTACDAAFIRPEVLNDHMNFHKGIRPYKCTVCPKTYSDRSGLMRHRKQHDLKKKREEMVEAKTVQLENLKQNPGTRTTNILLEAAILSKIDGGPHLRPSPNQIGDEDEDEDEDEAEIAKRTEAASVLARLQDEPSLQRTRTTMEGNTSTGTTTTSGFVTLTTDGFNQGWTLIDPEDVDANGAIFEASDTIIHAQDGTIFQARDGTIVAVESVVRYVDGGVEEEEEEEERKGEAEGEGRIARNVAKSREKDHRERNLSKRERLRSELNTDVRKRKLSNSRCKLDEKRDSQKKRKDVERDISSKKKGKKENGFSAGKSKTNSLIKSAAYPALECAMMNGENEIVADAMSVEEGSDLEGEDQRGANKATERKGAGVQYDARVEASPDRGRRSKNKTSKPRRKMKSK